MSLNFTKLPYVDGETVIPASNLNEIQDAILDLDSNKVEKEQGKGLSTNDYTNEEKAKVAAAAQATTATTIGPAPIVTFDASAADMPLKGLTVDIEPVQDLHGYDHPWPGGGGKNLAEPGHAWNINASGVIESATLYDCVIVKVNAGQTYCLSLDGNKSAVAPVLAFYSNYPSIGSASYDSSRAVDASNPFIAPIDGYAVIRLASGITKIQVELGSTATAYEPYSNICPITGWTGCNVTRTGKNLLNAALTYQHNDNVLRIGANNNNFALKFPAGQYTFSCSFLNDVHYGLLMQYEGGTTIVLIEPTSSEDTVTFPLENKPFRMWLYNSSGVSINNVANIQLEQGTSVTKFEPYSGNTYPIIFPASAGTVYGGTLDVANGKLTVTWAAFNCGRKTFSLETGTTGGKYFRMTGPTPARKYGEFGPDVYGICSSYTWAYNSNTINLAKMNNGYFGYRTTNGDVWFRDDRFETAVDFKAAMNGVLLVYQLATPIIYDLSDIPEILTLYGTNNIWADVGDVTVTYGAYLETVKKHADVVGDSILSAIAPLEASYTASRTYAVGSYLFVGTKFYKVVAAIAEGGTITPGTNVTQTTVAEQLIALAAG